MTDKRKQEIIDKLKSIVYDFEPSEDEEELTMFSLISEYNRRYGNPELIGGSWVRENIPELKDLP